MCLGCVCGCHVWLPNLWLRRQRWISCHSWWLSAVSRPSPQSFGGEGIQIVSVDSHEFIHHWQEKIPSVRRMDTFHSWQLNIQATETFLSSNMPGITALCSTSAAHPHFSSQLRLASLPAGNKGPEAHRRRTAGRKVGVGMPPPNTSRCTHHFPSGS